MISKKQKLAIVKMNLSSVNKALGTGYRLSEETPDYYNLTSPSPKEYFERDTLKSGDLSFIASFLHGILHGVAVTTNRMDEE